MKSEGITETRIRHDDTSANEVRGYFEPSFTSRTFDPLENSFATETLAQQVSEWRELGKTIVFSSGVYDLFHANHRTYLMHTKLAAAPNCWNKYGGYSKHWDDLSQPEKHEFTVEILESDLLKLIVSVDGNMAVEARKGFNKANGNSIRPIYDWSTMVRDVLSVAHETQTGRPNFIVDAVTIHDNVQPELKNTPHGGIMEIATYIKPDVWSVFFESEDIVEAIQTTHADEFSQVDLAVLPGQKFYSDKLLGETFHTSSIIKRIGASATRG